MFDARIVGDWVVLTGRFDASQVEIAYTVFDRVTTSAVVDFRELEYISSAGLGVLLKTQKRLKESGNGLKLINFNRHITEIFQYSGLDKIFEIDTL
ncbi:MAG TPA: STAS domain-containing protein [Bacteroidota bacterium]|nr:STAS domain-containing protein [Bacteroidota bacterium]